MNDSSFQSPPIQALLHEHLKAIGISDAELVRRAGYQNISKGLRRLEEVRAGNFAHAGKLLDALPAIFGVPPEVVTSAVSTAKREVLIREVAEFRRTFAPHAIIQCDRPRPEPLFVALAIGIDRLIRINFTPGTPALTYVRQALDGVESRLREWRSGIIPAFGRPTGVFVNYAWDKAVAFDLSGTPIRLLDHAVRTGAGQVSIGGRPISPAEFQQFIGA